MSNDIDSIQCVEDARQRSRCRVPKMFYDSVDSSSWSGAAYAANESAFAALKFRQRIGKNILLCRVKLFTAQTFNPLRWSLAWAATTPCTTRP